MNDSAQLVANALCPLLASVKLRTIILTGCVCMTLSMCATATFTLLEYNNLIIAGMMCFLASHRMSIGTFVWVYCGAVACEEALSISTAILWTSATIVSISTTKMFATLGSAGTFFLFAAFTACFGTFFFFSMKEIQGLTREESQLIYAKFTDTEEDKLMRSMKRSTFIAE